MSTQRPPRPKSTADEAVTTSPMWAANLSQPATPEIEPHSWADALRSLGTATMSDQLEELLYSQAPDAIRQAGMEPTPERIEAWVIHQLHAEQHRSVPATKTS